MIRSTMRLLRASIIVKFVLLHFFLNVQSRRKIFQKKIFARGQTAFSLGKFKSQEDSIGKAFILQIEKNPGKCSATLIAPKWVKSLTKVYFSKKSITRWNQALSAAHCFAREQARFAEPNDDNDLVFVSANYPYDALIIPKAYKESGIKRAEYWRKPILSNDTVVVDEDVFARIEKVLLSSVPYFRLF